MEEIQYMVGGIVLWVIFIVIAAILFFIVVSTIGILFEALTRLFTQITQRLSKWVRSKTTPVIRMCQVNNLVALATRKDYERASKQMWKLLEDPVCAKHQTQPEVLKVPGVFVFDKESKGLLWIRRHAFLEQATMWIPGPGQTGQEYFNLACLHLLGKKAPNIEDL